MAKEETKKEKSAAYVAYAKLIEDYKKQNPLKYEVKKNVLAQRLATYE